MRSPTTLRAQIAIPDEHEGVAKIRQRLQTRGSTNLAWYQLQFAGIQKPDNSNKVFSDRYGSYVAEGKQLGGVDVPSEYDNLDLVVFDRHRKQVTVCECKYASATVRTPEFRDEFDFFDKSGVTWKNQLQPRIDWVRRRLNEMAVPGCEDDLTDWTVDGCILTNVATCPARGLRRPARHTGRRRPGRLQTAVRMSGVERSSRPLLLAFRLAKLLD